MVSNDTHDQAGGATATVISSALVVGLVVVGAWRWWIAPRRAAARASEAPALVEAREAARAQLGEVESGEVELEAPAAELRWEAPGECIEVYAIATREEFRDASVAAFVGHEPEHQRWLLALGRREDSRSASAALGVLLATDGADEARERQLWWSPTAVGPAAPDLACRRQGWDPVEDAIALGWPALPDARVRVGASWAGGDVEGRCHETVCVDDDGDFPHDRPCRALPWTETLAGASAGELAVVLGRWTDGHDPAREEIGILTSRLLILDEGRPLSVRATVDHRWSGVRRELSLRRVDDCGVRSLARPEDAAAVELARRRWAAVARP